jgi:hypothetical protein
MPGGRTLKLLWTDVDPTDQTTTWYFDVNGGERARVEARGSDGRAYECVVCVLGRPAWVWNEVFRVHPGKDLPPDPQGNLLHPVATANMDRLVQVAVRRLTMLVDGAG